MLAVLLNSNSVDRTCDNSSPGIRFKMKTYTAITRKYDLFFFFLCDEANTRSNNDVLCKQRKKERKHHQIKMFKHLKTIAKFGHATRHDGLSKTVLQGTLQGGRRRGRQKKCWMDIKEWTSLPMPELLTRASCRKDWKRISAESSLVSPRRPARSKDRTELS